MQCYAQLLPLHPGETLESRQHRVRVYAGGLVARLIADLMHMLEASDRSSDYLVRQAVKWHANQREHRGLPPATPLMQIPMDWRPEDDGE